MSISNVLEEVLLILCIPTEVYYGIDALSWIAMEKKVAIYLRPAFRLTGFLSVFLSAALWALETGAIQRGRLGEHVMFLPPSRASFGIAVTVSQRPRDASHLS